MSGFFGIFRPQGAPVDLETLEKMKTDMHSEGFDGMETHVEEKIAMGHLMLRVSPESKYDKQPLKSSCGNYILVGHFRLDYRDELGDKLGLTQSELEVTPDSQLALLAYQKWKEKCVNHLEGDWAFVVYSHCLNSIFLAKDRSGQSALFYALDSEQILFSSDVINIGAIFSPRSQLNVKQFLRLSLPGVRVQEGFTLLEKLFHVKCGESIYFDSSLGVSKIKYFSFNDIRVVKFKFDDDYYNNSRSIFFQAIKSRIRIQNRLGIFLSGGFDSSAVASVTAKELLNQSETLRTYTSYPAFLSQFTKLDLEYCDERSLVEYIVNENSNINPTYINSPDIKASDSFFEGLDKDFFHPVASINTFWINEIFQTAKHDKLKLLFNAQLGNFTISISSPFAHSDLFLKFKLRGLFQDFKTLNKTQGDSYVKLVKYKILIPLFLKLKSGVNFIKLYSRNYFLQKFLLPYEIYVQNVFEKFKNLEEFIPEYYFIRGSRLLRIAILEKNVGFLGMIWYKIATRYALESTDPTSDMRVILNSLTVPEFCYARGGGKKNFYLKVFGGFVNRNIINNNKTMVQSADFGYRLKEDEKLMLMMEEIKSERSTCFRTHEISELYKEIKNTASPQKKLKKINYLLLSVSMINFYFSNKFSNFNK
jgi:asparagine synthase (glutamine-hydrolysing)